MLQYTTYNSLYIELQHVKFPTQGLSDTFFFFNIIVLFDYFVQV